ncbi:MAG: protein kinase, partial [Planctomycetes bacterium]|nr:protein kinase [Planctomycetota bacterium]
MPTFHDSDISWDGDEEPSQRPEASGEGAASYRSKFLPAVSISERYELLQEVGRGGMGKVYLAFDRFLDREVALKQLLAKHSPAHPHTNPADTNMVIERFLREAKVTAQLDHPNIIPIYEIAEREDGEIFYTMKFVRGVSLLSRLDAINTNEELSDDQKLDERLKLLGYFIDACHGVAYAHSKGVLHRDIKPENVMIGKYGESLVVDWGLAKIIGQEESEVETDIFKSGMIQVDENATDNLTQAGSIFGTPAYLAPEQARGENSKVGPHSDIFSLGAMLYELISGHSPLHAETLRATLFKAAMGEFQPLEEVCPNAPRELCAIVARTMAKKPEDRWKSADDLAAELEAWRSGGRVSIYEYSSYELFKRFVSRNKGKLIAAGLVIAATAGVFAFNAWQDHAAFNEALAERRGALSKAEKDIETRKPTELLAQAESEIKRLETQQAAYSPSTPVPELAASAKDDAPRSRELIAAAEAIDERLRLANEPVKDEFVTFIPSDERQGQEKLSQSLRVAAAKLEALLGGWKLAEEIILSTPGLGESSKEYLSYVA